MKRGIHLALLSCALSCTIVKAAPTPAATDLAAKLKVAKAGTTVTLPPGTINTAGLIVPAGVNLKGSGYRATRLVVKGQIGVRISAGRKNEVSDLTVQGADNAGVSVENSSGVTLSRVRVVRCLTGIIATGGKDIVIQNCVAGENRSGIVLGGVTRGAVVNCTMAANSSLGLSVSGTSNSAAFNNVMALNGIGVYLAESNKTFRLDNNFYYGALLGKGRDVPVPLVTAWRDLENQDHHSLAAAITFSDGKNFIYKPATPRPWQIDRAVTSGWGAAALAGFKAPAADIDGQPHKEGICAGAWEAFFKAPRLPDGTFTVGGPGYSSAGLYDEKNRLVCWLFNLQPLAEGKHPYWLPSRDYQGRVIAAGAYKLRTLRAYLHLKYIASPGNTAVTPRPEAYASTGITQLVFDSRERPILCLNWSESYRQFRGMDPMLQHERWNIPGSNRSYGAASNGAGRLFSLRDADDTTYVLSRIDEERGTVDEVAPNDYGWYFKKADVGTVSGIAAVEDRMYLAATDRNKLWVSQAASPKFDKGIDIGAPLSPAGDRERNWVWLISNRNRVVAYDGAGVQRVSFDPQIRDLYALAVKGNSLALLSLAGGKIYLYDVTNPAAPRVLRNLGTGDGPYGPIKGDRFNFQTSTPGENSNCRLALASDGTLAVTDTYGVKLFHPDGALKRDFTGIWGQYIERGAWQPGEPLELVDLVSLRTMKLDEKDGSWRFDMAYQPPAFPGFELDSNTGFFFLREGKRYRVAKGYRVTKDGAGKVTARTAVFLVARYDGAVCSPLVAFGPGEGGKLARLTDFSKSFNDPANWAPVNRADGTPIVFSIDDPLIPSEAGDLIVVNTIANRVRLKGFDAAGVPDYDWDTRYRTPLAGDSGNSIVSPYDFKTVEQAPTWVRHGEIHADGSIVATDIARKSAPNGSGFANWAANYVAGYGPDGHMRWLQPMTHIKDPQGAKILDDVSYSVGVQVSEVQMLDKDGLFLGESGAPHELYWGGMWLDNSHQFSVLKGNTGKHYVVLGNFNDCTAWWMEVQGRETINHTEAPVVISTAKAAVLAALPLPEVWKAPENTTARVTIVKTVPMVIDGDPAKWRKLLPTPQIIVTPETGKDTRGPADLSAVIRLAHEGSNLYVQAIRFDDVIAMHQPLALFYKQDALEMALNSYLTGVKINLARTRDHGDVVYRDGWFLPAKELDAKKAPRTIKVFENAGDFPERKLIERIYGVDLSKAHATIMEFKVPLDDETFEGRKEDKPTGASGSTMALGLAVDDNDTPGADVQKLIVWPATYGTFANKSVSAVVTFE